MLQQPVPILESSIEDDSKNTDNKTQSLCKEMFALTELSTLSLSVKKDYIDLFAKIKTNFLQTVQTRVQKRIKTMIERKCALAKEANEKYSRMRTEHSQTPEKPKLVHPKPRRTNAIIICPTSFEED